MLTLRLCFSENDRTSYTGALRPEKSFHLYATKMFLCCCRTLWWQEKKKSWTEKRMMIFGRWEGIRSVLYGLTLAAKQSSFTVIRGRQRIWTPVLTAVDVVPGPLWGIFCLLLSPHETGSNVIKKEYQRDGKEFMRRGEKMWTYWERMRKNRKALQKYTIIVRLHFKHYQVIIMTSKLDHCARLLVLTLPQE